MRRANKETVKIVIAAVELTASYLIFTPDFSHRTLILCICQSTSPSHAGVRRLDLHQQRHYDVSLVAQEVMEASSSLPSPLPMPLTATGLRKNGETVGEI